MSQSEAKATSEPDCEAILRAEFGAEEGSFLLQLRINVHWDKAAFSRLTTAMDACAAARTGDGDLPRWMAQGYWYVGSYVADWLAHQNNANEHDAAYYETAQLRLYELAYYLFMGESPSYKPLPPI